MFSKRLSSLGVLMILAAVGSGLLLAQSPQPVGTWVGIGVADNPFGNGASVALTDGRVLIVGGSGPDGAATNLVSTFDTATNQFAIAGMLLSARTGHTATLLNDGRVLVTGGITNGLVSTDVELFDPSTGASTLVGQMAEPRRGHVAALLQNGSVLLAGGYTTEDVILQSAFIFDPATSSISPTPNGMNVARASASATSLIDGRVVIIGGTNNGTNDLRSAEIYDPALQSFTTVSTQLSVPVRGHSAVLLPHNGSVLVAGGTSNNVAQAGAELFLPAEFPDPFSWGVGQFAPTNAMNAARSGAIAGPTAYEGYSVVTGGGLSDVERYRFATIKTDRDDYAPGETALITGSGWQPNEEVRLVFQEDPAVHEDYVLTVTAGPDGTIRHDTWAPEEHDANVRFYLMATGRQSGRRAQMTFTDSVNFNNLQVANQVPIAVAPGDIATFVITVKFNVNGAATPPCTVGNFTTTGLAAINATATFSPTSVTSSGPDQQVTMTVTTTATTLIGNNNGLGVAAVGTSGCTDNKSATFAVRVEAATSLNLAAPNPASVTQGSAGPVSLSATLSRGATLLNNQTINFRVDGVSVGSGTTNASGVATLSYNPSTLSAGPHTVTAFYAGANNVGGASTSNPETLTVTNAAVSITVNTNPAGRSFTVDGTTYTSAQTLSWTPGSTHTISTTSPQSGGTGIQYVWANWNDGGAISHTVTAPASATTYTANFTTQRQTSFATTGMGADTGSNTVLTLQVNGGSAVTYSKATLPTNVWYDDGTTLAYTYTATVNSSPASGTRYQLTGTSPTSPQTVGAALPTTITGTYQVQRQVSFTTTGMGADTGTNTVLTLQVNSGTSTTYSKATLPTNTWYDDGTILTYSFAGTVNTAVTTKRYQLTNTTPTSPQAVAAALTITGTYVAQRQVSFATIGLLNDTGGNTVLNLQVNSDSAVSYTKTTLPTNAWYDETATLTYSFAATVNTDPDSMTRYRLTTTSPTSPQSVAALTTVTGTYVVQRQISFTAFGIGADTGTNIVLQLQVNGGTAVDYTKATLPTDAWYDDGTTLTYTYTGTVNTDPSSTKRYRLTGTNPASPETVSAGLTTITGTYVAQRQLSFTASGLSNDTGGNTVLNLQVNSDAAVDYTQTTLPTDVWYDDGTLLTYGYSPFVNTDPSSAKRYRLTNTSPTSPQTIGASSTTITGTYVAQRQVSFTTSGLGDDIGTSIVLNLQVNSDPAVNYTKATLPTNAWYDESATLTYSYAATVNTDPASTTRYRLTGTSPASPQPVSALTTVTGTYVLQRQVSFTTSGIGADTGANVVLTLQVNSDPAANFTQATLPTNVWYDDGTVLIYSYAGTVNTAPASTKRYRLTGTSPTSAQTVAASMTITGTYVTQHQVSFATSGMGADTGASVVLNLQVNGDPAVNYTQATLPTNTWYDDGTILTHTYTGIVNTDPASAKRYRLTGTSQTSPYTVAASLTITGTYVVQRQLSFTTSGLGADTGSSIVLNLQVNGDPSVGYTKATLPTNAWYDDGTTLTYSYAATVDTDPASGKRYRLTATNPASPATVAAGLTTIAGTYVVQWKLTFIQSGIGTDTGANNVVTIAGSPHVAANLPHDEWIDNGSPVSYAYQSYVNTAASTKRYRLTSVTGIASGTNVLAASTITGNYVTQWLVTWAQTGLPTLSGPTWTGANTVVSISHPTVSPAAKTVAVLPFSQWFDQGSNVSYTYSTSISTDPVSSIQYELNVAASTLPSTASVSAATAINGDYSTNNYTIQYLQPLDQSTATSYHENTGKNGRVVPVKVQIFKNGTAIADTSTVYIKLMSVQCSSNAGPGDPIEEYADAGASNGNTNLFRWSVPLWIYNLDTKAIGLQNSNCYRFDVYLNALSGSTAIKASAATWAVFKPVK